MRMHALRPGWRVHGISEPAIHESAAVTQSTHSLIIDHGSHQSVDCPKPLSPLATCHLPYTNHPGRLTPIPTRVSLASSYRKPLTLDPPSVSVPVCLAADQ